MLFKKGSWVFSGLIIFASCITSGRAQDLINYSIKTFHIPGPYPKGTFRQTIWVNSFFMPTDLTNVAIGAPMFNYSARYSFGKGWGAEGTFSTLFVSNRLSAGPSWSTNYKKFHFGFTYFIGYNLGVLNDFGFATVLTAWNQTPTASFGYRFNKSALTLKFGWEYFGNVDYRTGSNSVKMEQRVFNGWFTRIVMEQKLWKNHTASFSVCFNRMNFVMLAWPAYPVNNKRYLIPEVSMGITL
jgi:hypothetical protein